jgi:hypothetical protein
MLKGPRLVFVVAYVVSFVLGLLLLRREPPLEGGGAEQDDVVDEALSSYRRWLAAQGASSGRLSADEVSYGRRGVDTEAEFLRRRVHVTCVVFARKIRKVNAIKHTWGRHCNRIVFYATAIAFYASASQQEKSVDVGVRLLEKPKSSWHFLCSVINEARFQLL